MNLDTPLSQLSGVGPGTVWKLKKLGLETIEDLIYHFPFRYDDFSQIKEAQEAQIGEVVTLQGEVWSIKNIYTRFGRVLTQAIFNDGSSPIVLTWFNQGWLTKQIQVGDRLQISGKLTKYKSKLSIMAPQWERINSLQSTANSPQTLHTGRLVPVYPETANLTSKWFRTKISQLLPQVLPEVKDPLPDFIKDKMLNLDDALQKIHFPQALKDVEKAKERLGFDELFFVSLATAKARKEWKDKPVIKPLTIYEKALEQFIKGLPFDLTVAQQRVVKEVLEDLKKEIPMNRLIQGEVGSGKTVVAAIIIYLVHLNNLKTLFMAPTEILAFQHYSTITNLLEPFGISVGIYTGSKKSLESRVNPSINSGLTSSGLSDEAESLRVEDLSKVEWVKSQGKNNSRLSTLATSHSPDVIIGTHALLSTKLHTPGVGLVIIDEQQRFGVEQRSYLRSRAKLPHLLTTTATPIPRTVALTLYGDLDLSIIDELPKNRPKISTFLVPEKKRADSYKFIEKKVKEGDQIYIITPLIEPSETLATTKAAKVEYEKLKTIFPNLKLGLLHGRMKSKEKEQTLKDFQKNIIQILVSTSVVEVGMDIPNATVIVIEGAERFGLAQLHQLRGRVGRGVKKSYCLLYTSDVSSNDRQRLKYLETTFDGLKLAELDLKIRGSGEIFGVKQSGRFEFKIASLGDIHLIEKTRSAANNLLSLDPSLDKYPLLKAKLQDLTKGVMPD